ncbi:MAG: glycosyltransferase family 4 protein [Wenzhouxiangella sp.]
MNTTLPPIALAAYQCAPGQGSVSQIGWEWASRLSTRRPVILFTHSRNRPAIEAAGGLAPGSEIHFIDTEWMAGPLYRLARRLFPNSEHGVFLIASLDFFLFDWLALKRLRRRRRQPGAPALVHIVTPVTLAAPSRLHRSGLPVILGPLNCGLHSPPGFTAQLRDESPWLIRLRELPRLLDGVFGATRRARLILTASQATRQAVPARHRHKTRPLLENAIDPADFQPTDWPLPPGPDQPLKLLFIGRMIRLKGVDLLLNAIARLKDQGQTIETTLVGDGPCRQEWQQLAAELGLQDQTRFTGALDRRQVAAALSDCHLLCLPSVRESGGAVLLEAMASARPVVALGHGGPAELVDEQVGRAIPLYNPAQVIDALSETFKSVIEDPEAWQQRGQNGLKRVHQRWTWTAKLNQAEAHYQSLLAPTTRQPASPSATVKEASQ